MTLLQTASHAATHVSAAHLEAFYKTFDEVRDRRFDGMIITGAPVETIPFEQVDYWDELCGIMDWSKSSVYSGAGGALPPLRGAQGAAARKDVRHLSPPGHPAGQPPGAGL